MEIAQVFGLAPPSRRGYLSPVSTARREFWARHPGLVWSSSAAGDEVYIRAALVRPRFSQLLEIAVEFGPGRLRAEWNELCSQPAAEVERARPVVERILRNIEKGAAIAAGRN
jgi:hypothetical protein